ncbi:S-DNA-T family DNA segregation ATPase FtsK/SpoIIIE [Methylorubrum rhodinum]|uniref:S-DNA-T family DNA segregation ATPase FtsK/SpoIIIE n=1 Tax=Methylorubrum rhodinum TaxID=29428 RepID=A0A840ZIN7_9HYPH|nr:DNA translocase FtsK [Methylorubrum rhodinum]MBB5757446.1 S-DNA-T family DNA segregation ATPase FtsK/SpoIIIE [Methylorubrum rhodinum]
MNLRANLTRRFVGAPPAPPRALPRALPHPHATDPAVPGPDGFEAGAMPSWLVPPGAMLGRGPAPQDWEPQEPAFEMPAPARPYEAYADQAEPAFESRIDTRASGPGVLVRTPRRPAAIAPEAAPLPAVHAMQQGLAQAMPQLNPEPAVRFTRTPDPVLMERRRRALEAEREAQDRAQALLDAQIAAEAAAREAEQARLAAIEAAEREAEAAAVRAEESARALAAQTVESMDGVPSWRRPFVPPPGVRFFRTPDRRPKPAEPVPVVEVLPEPVAVEAVALPAEAVFEAPFIPPVPAEPSDWADVPDWSELHGWFGPAEGQVVEVRVVEVPAPEAQAPEAHAVEASVIEAFAVEAAVVETAPVESVPVEAVAPAAERPAFQPVPRRRLHAMAARAAIFPADAFEAWNGPGFATAEAPAAVPAPSPAPQEIFVEPEAFAPQPVAPAHTVAAVQPLTIPARPVLLRSKAAPADEAALIAEAFEEPVIEAIPEPVVEEPAEEVAPAPVAAEPENRPRAYLPERPALIPAGRHLEMTFVGNADYELPSLELLAEPPLPDGEEVDADELEQNALNLQQTVQDFGVRGDILAVRPGPVVTLYELEPAPGTKSSRVIGLSDDIARSMSAVSARVAVVPGRNVIGIELPNQVRETVYLRELLASVDFVDSKHKLALCLGKNIGGEPIIADLARMPHLLVAGTTGSGKSVAINTMILSLLYRLKPEECRLIMVDPKMLELSVYDGIPHLLSPVVIDPKKAVIALKWAVREMEERYKKMSKISVRNIDGYNARMKEARERGEIITRTVQTGFDRTTGEAVFEEQEMDRSALPYIVIVVDEMADLMMVAGKDIEGAIQRLAQMARAAGIHLIMATQRPSVDVITGTIKANFPTRISFQVTSKIDSRTILGEMGAEQLLGQGDMLFMAGGGRTTRVHGPFCSDSEVETVVAHLKRQGRPSYLEAVTADDGSSDQPEKPAKGGKAAAKAEKDDFAEVEEADAPVFDIGAFAATAGAEGGELYEQAIAVVLRDRKASTSYIQRRLQIGYNRAASIMERMEIEGIVGPANHAGKREILVEGLGGAPAGGYDDE